MRVAIIGAGFGGLSAGYFLAKKGVQVTIFESDKLPGGLAIGFENKNWEWSLEKHYHHWFTNDESVLNLAKEIGHEVIIKTPKTSTFVGGEILQLDSPLSLLLFNKLPIIDRIRTGLLLAYLKYTTNWKALEKVTAKSFLIKFGGKAAWKTLWDPLFSKKFSYYADQIPAAWFWARIKKRTQSLAYPQGGFLDFAIHLSQKLTKMGVQQYYKISVSSIEKNKDKIVVKTVKNKYEFDKVIVTSPSFTFTKITKGLPTDYVNRLLDLKGIGAVNLVLALNKQFLEDGSYWLNINAKHFPFLAVVEHTNFMDKKYYGDNHLLYIGNYLPHEHEYYKKEAADLLRDFYPYMKTINPKFSMDWVNEAYIFKAPFAQPIIPLNYSSKIPAFETPIKNLYLCNIQQVYPWDRGTNYAVVNGKKVAELILNE
jgi:protoporphyrinogen oxidase